MPGVKSAGISAEAALQRPSYMLPATAEVVRCLIYQGVGKVGTPEGDPI